MALNEYRKKRDFQQTDEPSGGEVPGGESDATRLFVVQKHGASRLHYDFRLEHDGVLLSWAVPKGPSIDPEQRRLAVRVEDHPLEYADFEGVIPEGQYGGGPVLLWDRGRWEPEGDPGQGLSRGKLSFRLEGEKLTGRWSLIRMGNGDDDGRNWLLIHSTSASSPEGREPVEARPESVTTGRTLEEVVEEQDGLSSGEEESGGSGTPERRRADLGPPDPSVLSGARQGAVPEAPEPQLATRVDAPPGGEEWLHEVKLDGYRILAIFRNGELSFRTRGGKDWTSRFPRVGEALSNLLVEEAVIDGEMVYLLPDGSTSFQDLQRALGRRETNDGHIGYYAFDLLHLDGYDLRGVSLLERKRTLRTLLGASGLVEDETRGWAAIRYSDHIRGGGSRFLQEACRLALEGAVSKRASSPYREGRTRDWVKSKCMNRQEFVVIGFTDPSGARSGFGSLLLAYYRTDDSLAYAGRVGTGFTARSLEELAGVLREIEQDKPPLDRGTDRRSGAAGIHWVAPRMVVEVEFTEWTRDGVLRHPVFKGLREDLDPTDVTRESSRAPARPTTRTRKPAKSGSKRGNGMDFEGVRLTHPDRVLYPEQGVTKRRLAEYYRDVGERLLQYAAHRPLTLVRCPRGRGEECFYQKHVNHSVPDEVSHAEIEESDGKARYLVLDSVASLIALVQIGTLEVHVWGSRVDRLERPDRIVFDLDPGSGVAWIRVIEAARELRDRLKDIGLESFVTTTGGKGLHVTLPIVRRHGWDEVKAFAREMAREMASAAPERYVAKAAKSARTGRIYIDWLRNARGATAVAPYSTRARPGAPIAVPLRWEELGPEITSDRYKVDTVLRRLAALQRDPWEGFSRVRQSITQPMREALGLGKREAS